MNATVKKLRNELKLAQKQRDLYRVRAIDEVADHHHADAQAAMFDVDYEMKRRLMDSNLYLRNYYRP